MSNKLRSARQQAMRCVAWLLPGVVVCATLLHASRAHFSKSTVVAGVLLLIASCILARFLSLRSDDRTAQFISVVVSSQDDEDHKEAVELTALAGAAVLLALTVFWPLNL